MLSPFSAAPRLVAVVASGAFHATVFASLAFTTPGQGPRAAETVLILETVEDVPVPPPVIAPLIEPVSNVALEAHHQPDRAPSSKKHEATVPSQALTAAPAAAPDFLARLMMTSPPTAASVPAADEESALGMNGGEGTAGSTPETTYGEDDVSTPAKLLSNVNATYPMQAWSSGVEADVPVEIVVDAQGRVASARVVTRAGYGFDDAALASIESYRFAAAQRDGHAVRVRVRWSVQFRMRR